jgi:hypothetical protein
VPMRFTSSCVPVGMMTTGCSSRGLIFGGRCRSSSPPTFGVPSSTRLRNRLGSEERLGAEEAPR